MMRRALCLPKKHAPCVFQNEFARVYVFVRYGHRWITFCVQSGTFFELRGDVLRHGLYFHATADEVLGGKLPCRLNSYPRMSDWET